MKEYKGDNTLRKVFESRQLGLKLIANVTYGYTSANFSGRMPCVELGDSVVSKGRETLERTIHMIEERSEWNARVVYGDTDSVFILLPGRTKQEAFAVGAEIAEAVTQTNPPPVKLKFEKVYHPCILQVCSSNEPLKWAKSFQPTHSNSLYRRRSATLVINMKLSIRKILFTRLKG